MAWHGCHFVSFMMMSLVPSLKNTASIFLEVFFIQYFTINGKPHDVICFQISILQKCQYV